MATGGEQMLRVTAIVFVLICSTCVSVGGVSIARDSRTWRSNTLVSLDGESVHILTLKKDDLTFPNGSDFKFALSSEPGKEGSKCSSFVTLPTKAIVKHSHDEHTFYLRLKAISSDYEGEAWICTSEDGSQWTHQGPESAVFVQTMPPTQRLRRQAPEEDDDTTRVPVANVDDSGNIAVTKATTVTDEEKKDVKRPVIPPPEGGIHLIGLRVESHGKEVVLSDEGTGALLAHSEALVRLFGSGFTDETEVLFTAEAKDKGEKCTVKTSSAFRIIPDPGHNYALVKVVLPPMGVGQEKWYICVRHGDTGTAEHQGSVPWLAMTTYETFIPVWSQVILLVILLILSGLFSGLNLGLMALDKTELKIVSNTGTPTEQKYARAIEPVRRHGNFLLCTLLLGNVLVNSTLTILLDGLTSGIVAVIGSTIGIVIFGEIIPQAICSRHGLAIGARTVWLVRVFMVITGLVAWPISKVLDLLLGEELGNTYDRERLKELIKVTHGQNDLKDQEQNIICGALELHKKTVQEVMTPIDDVFMLNIESFLDFNTINEIMQQGYSRIPVYENERTNLVSVLFIKDLAFIDPDDNTPLRTICNYYQNTLNFVFEDTTLDNIFKEFKEGNKGHLALIHRINNEGEGDPFYEVVGLVTLEDVIEELIQEEIVDETDVVTDNRSKRRRMDRMGRRDFKEFLSNNPAHSKYRRILVSPQLQVACFQYLRSSLEPFKEGMLSENMLKRLLTQDVVNCIKLPKGPSKDNLESYLYMQGKPADYFTLILEGHVEVTIGKENLVFESGPFSYFALGTLLSSSNIGESPSASTQLSRSSGLLGSSLQSLDRPKFSFIPDYSVRATCEVVFLRLKKSQYIAARRAFLLEKSQKDNTGGNEQFDKEMAKILNEEEGMSPPAWETTPLHTPNSKEFIGNGIPVTSESDNLSLTADSNPPYTSAVASPQESQPSTRAGTPKLEEKKHHASKNNYNNSSEKQLPRDKDFPGRSKSLCSAGSNTDDGAQSIKTSPSGTDSQVSPVSKNEEEKGKKAVLAKHQSIS